VTGNACTTGEPEAQMVPFLLAWTSDPNGEACMIFLYQEELAWGNESYKTLVLVSGSKWSRTEALQTIRPLTPNANYTLCLSWYGESLTFVHNLTGCDKSWSFDKMSNQSTLTKTQAKVWWYCGGPLLEILLENWSGTCILVQLAISFTLAFQKPTQSKGELRSWTEKNTDRPTHLTYTSI
jgi:hypothetical protein